MQANESTLGNADICLCKIFCRSFYIFVNDKVFFFVIFYIYILHIYICEPTLYCILSWTTCSRTQVSDCGSSVLSAVGGCRYFKTKWQQQLLHLVGCWSCYRFSVVMKVSKMLVLMPAELILTTLPPSRVGSSSSRYRVGSRTSVHKL